MMSSPRGDDGDPPNRSQSASSAGSRSVRATSSSTDVDNKEAFIARLTGRTTIDNFSHLTRPQVLGVHHLKFAVSNLDVSIAWYERVLGARRIPTLDHVQADGNRVAAVCQMTDWNGLYLELRQSETQARRVRGWDLITLSVRGRQDLLVWIDWLDRWGTTHSPLLTGLRGWLLVFEDPDGRRLRIYTRESHGGTETPSLAEYWLNET